jgi:hypothetical protein
MLSLEETIISTYGYVFTGADAFAIQVINICTGYILFFIAIAVLMKSLIAGKAENANVY